MADWLKYANQNKTRRLPLSADLIEALSFMPDLGVTMEVFSGGQGPKGSGQPRTGSTRHDHGNAADVYFYKGDRRLDWANPDDQPLFREIVQRAKANGVTGFGAGEGYMRPGSMHIGFGKPAVWGKGGSGANAAGWLQAAYNGQGNHTFPGVPKMQPGVPTPQPGALTFPESGGVLQNIIAPDNRAKSMMLSRLLSGNTEQPMPALPPAQMPAPPPQPEMSQPTFAQSLMELLSR